MAGERYKITVMRFISRKGSKSLSREHHNHLVLFSGASNTKETLAGIGRIACQGGRGGSPAIWRKIKKSRCAGFFN